MLIGITGTDGAGKGSVVAYLVERYGFTHYSSRATIIPFIRAAGLPETRNQMRLTANALRAERGDDVLVQLALEHIKVDQSPRSIIESIRAVAEARTLKEQGGFLLAIDADQQVRYERVQVRRSETDQVTFAEFVAHEALEASDPDPHGMQKTAVMRMADETIFNNGTIEALHERLDGLMRRWGI